MRFSDYLSEALWAAFDKALPLIYGFGYVVVVVPVLPEAEFGLLGIIEVIFYFILALDNSLVQTPMAKFVAENEEGSWAIPNGFLLSAIIFSTSACLYVLGGGVMADLFKAPELEQVHWYVPALLASFYLKNLTSQICVARQWTGRLFTIDALYFLGSLTLLITLRLAGTLANAAHVILANIIMAVVASLAGLLLARPVLRSSPWRVRGQEMLRFLSFGKFSLGAGLGAYLNAQLDTIFVAHYFGPVQVGIYRAGKIIYRFYNAFSQAAQVIILPLASKFGVARDRVALRALFEKSIFFSYLILIPLNVGLWLGADWIFSQLYGGKYLGGVLVFRWLLLGACALPWGTIGINLLLGAGKPNLTFRITWLTVLIYTGSSFFLVQNMGIIGAAIATVIGVFVGALLTSAFVHTLIPFTWRGILQRHVDARLFFEKTWRDKRLGSRR